MPVPLEVTFHQLPRSVFVASRIREKAQKLARFCDRIIGCEVVVEAPHAHHKKGRLHHVRITLHLPGGQITVNREHHDKHSHEDLFVALRDSFNAVQRKLEDQVRRRHRRVKVHENPPQGWVSRLVPTGDYGNIESNDGRLIYFHRNSVQPPGFEALAIGNPVAFVESAGDQGPQASMVRLLVSRRTAA
jgi:ribosomal subunit interface protein